MNTIFVASFLLIAVPDGEQPSAIDQNNLAASRHAEMAKKVAALVRDTAKALDRFAAVKGTMTDQQIAIAEQFRVRMSAHFVDAVALRSESRVTLTKSGKYIEAARFATTEEEIAALLTKAGDEALKSQALSLRATDAAADARAWLSQFTAAIETANRTID